MALVNFEKRNAVIDMDIEKFTAVHTFADAVVVAGKQAIRVTKDSQIKAFDEPTFARLAGRISRMGSSRCRC